MRQSTLQSIFFWIIWSISILGLLTIVYGYYTGSLNDESPYAMAFLAGVFALSPTVILIE